MGKEYILLSAAQVFREKGFHGASMADIAEAADLQKASLYHHFSSKQEILLQLLDRALELVTAQMEAVMIQDLPADRKLRLAIREYLCALAERGDLVSVLLLEYRSLEPKYYSRHIPHRDQFEAMWRSLIGSGVESGLFVCDHIPLAVRGLMGMMNWAITWYRQDGPSSLDDIAENFSDIFLKGISATN